MLGVFSIPKALFEALFYENELVEDGEVDASDDDVEWVVPWQNCTIHAKL